MTIPVYSRWKFKAGEELRLKIKARSVVNKSRIIIVLVFSCSQHPEDGHMSDRNMSVITAYS
jgi:hypothetical protein